MWLASYNKTGKHCWAESTYYCVWHLSFAFWFEDGRSQTGIKRMKISDTSFHCEDKHIAEFLHLSWHGFLYIHQLICLQLLWHIHWMWLVQVSMLAHKVWAFFAFILHSAMTWRYMHQMKVVSRWQLQHLQRVCLLWRESWHQFWCKWWNQPTQMDCWTMTVILASTRTCKLQVQKQDTSEENLPSVTWHRRYIESVGNIWRLDWWRLYAVHWWIIIHAVYPAGPIFANVKLMLTWVQTLWDIWFHFQI